MVAPADLGRVGELVAEHDEVGFAAATTGSSNLFLSVSTSALTALYDYLTVRLGELPGLLSHSTIPVLRTVKAATTRYSARRPRQRRPLGLRFSRRPASGERPGAPRLASRCERPSRACVDM